MAIIFAVDVRREMAFLTRKKVANKKYLQVVENYRQDGKHRQRVLRHIGPYASIEHALADWLYRAENMPPLAIDISLSDKQATMQWYGEMAEELRTLLAEKGVPVDEAELKRLREMPEGRRWSENRERISVG